MSDDRAPKGPTLVDLVREDAKAAGGVRKLAEKMPLDPDSGKAAPGYDALQKWLRGGRFPDPEMIALYAEGTGRTHAEVLDAAGRGVKLKIDRSDETLLQITIAAIPGTEDLTDEETYALATLIRGQVAAARIRRQQTQPDT